MGWLCLQLPYTLSCVLNTYSFCSWASGILHFGPLWFSFWFFYHYEISTLLSTLIAPITWLCLGIWKPWTDFTNLILTMDLGGGHGLISILWNRKPKVKTLSTNSNNNDGILNQVILFLFFPNDTIMWIDLSSEMTDGARARTLPYLWYIIEKWRFHTNKYGRDFPLSNNFLSGAWLSPSFDNRKGV